jgi:hypothetical protein
MAEFKLGRIRFIWKGDWAQTTVYYKDDIIRNGGNTYVCIAGHTSTSDFAADLETYWNKISDGQEWKGDWDVDIYYKVNDVVKYGGQLYIANTAHTSADNFADGLEADLGTDSSLPKWDLYGEGFDYKGNWTNDTRYKVNDVVKYNGLVYIAIEAHVSSPTTDAGLESDAEKWNVFSEGLYWTGIWTNNTRYVKNDIVKYGGQLYVANTGHTSAETDALGLEADQAKWDYVHKGIEYLGDWAAETRYKVNDVVKWGGGLWICITYHTSQTTLTQDEAKWSQFVEGLEFEDNWSGTKNYQPGDYVTYGGYSYVAKTNNYYKRPVDSPNDWALFTTGFRYVGEWGEDSSNYEYFVGDVVSLGGYTYLCTTDHTGERPPNATYWENLNEGFKWKGDWTDSTFYDAGDSVQHGVNTYVCVAAHTSDETVAQNRPDQDVDGSEWNLLTGGAESGNLTTAGDIVYYGGAGATRLPVGTPGQVLRVNSDGDAPEWANFGAINNVYYVESLNGVDEPAPSYGITLDRPWKTVRYAAEQVDQGPLRYNAKKLLEANRSFIQAEVVEYIDNTYPALVYDKAKCRRDAGQIVDALVWDMSHGGNERSRDAAISYFDDDGVTYLADNATETADGLNYIKTLADAILSNLAPASNYQTLNGVGSPITQVIDATYTEEADALATLETLVNITTDAITAGTTAGIPAEVKPNNTIFVKTGTFAEVLPIPVPEQTAIVGDELRSTKISPAGSIVDSADTPYTLAGLARLQAIMSDAISDPGNITKTGSNLEDPVTSRPVGSAAVGTIAADLVTQIIDYINWGVNGAAGDSTRPATGGTNVPQTSTDYTYAVESLEANRTFLVEEVIAYIAATYPLYTYDEDKCRRDVNRYIDAIKYDIIYQPDGNEVYGNYKSLLAARYYVNAVNGSLEEDMFYMRNATGLRNCTVQGLTGTLGSANSYGTSRPSAGAYVSLDPGWGPDDERVWINAKSPYIQNVTTFGTACVGLKVDGDLHNGGNDSIVANDFTQILSDGIGYWVTNLGRSELVSVFTYYCHIGYLAENGGKIRATNGNNSYGAYGSVAEGVDATEVPVTGSVTNQAFDAIVQNVLTDGGDILTFEYLNAGVGYTDATDAITGVTSIGAADANRTIGTYFGVTGTSSGAGTGQEFNITVGTNGSIESVDIVKGGSGHLAGDTITVQDSDLGGGGAVALTFDVDTIGDATQWTITGEGFGASIASTNVVNGGVYEVRLLNTDVDLDGEGDFGGLDYITATNVAQTGTSTQITLSNTDARLSSQYVGMAIWITAGTGAGQYGVIDTYNAGTKVATITKASDGSAGWDHVTGVGIEPTLDETTNYVIEPRVVFAAPPSGLYADTAKGRATVEDDKIIRITIWDPGQGYLSAPTMTITDPNNTIDVPHTVRIGDGVLAQPTWTDRGTGFATAEAEVTGDGYADLYQTGQYIQVEGLDGIPEAGSNVEIAGLPGNYYRLVSVTQLFGNGPYTARLQVSPDIEIEQAPEHGEGVTTRIRYSQVRLTGHDFLDIGTGNFANTNYPNNPLIEPDADKETNNFGGGRVFYTSTDQDGNFRVGELFSVEQSTGVATLNADAFNISGLQELQLGAVELGGTGAVITEFSTDGTFTANSDNIVPTQKAIRTYIASQIGGGAGELNVNSITAGSIQISTNVVETVTDVGIDVRAKMTFEKGVDGHPLAMNYYLLG